MSLARFTLQERVMSRIENMSKEESNERLNNPSSIPLDERVLINLGLVSDRNFQRERIYGEIRKDPVYEILDNIICFQEDGGISRAITTLEKKYTDNPERYNLSLEHKKQFLGENSRFYIEKFKKLQDALTHRHFGDDIEFNGAPENLYNYILSLDTHKKQIDFYNSSFRGEILGPLKIHIPEEFLN